MKKIALIWLLLLPLAAMAQPMEYALEKHYKDLSTQYGVEV